MSASREGSRACVGESAASSVAPGHPLEDFDLVADPDKNFIMTMKDGKIYKNALSEVGN